MAHDPTIPESSVKARDDRSGARRPIFIVNESAGSAPRIMAAIEPEDEAGRLELRLCASGEKIAPALRLAAKQGAGRIVVCGGDGTVRSAINTLRDQLSSIEIGIVPAGTGNDLARSLGLPDRHAEAVRLAIEGAARPIDVIEAPGIENPLVLNCIMAGIGAGASAGLSPSSKRFFGPLAYWAAALGELMSPPQIELSFTIDDAEFELVAHGFAIANGRTVGGGFSLAPDIILDDGQFDLLVLPVQSVPETLLDAIGSLLGREELPQGVLHIRGQRCSVQAHVPVVMSIDGEPVSLERLDAQLHPGLAPLVCEPPAAS